MLIFLPKTHTRLWNILAHQNALKLTYCKVAFQKISGDKPRTPAPKASSVWCGPTGGGKKMGGGGKAGGGVGEGGGIASTV